MNNNFRFKKADIGIFNTNNTDLIANKVGKDCRVMGLTMGNFSLIDLIYSILKKIKGGHVICTTWSAGIKDINQIEWMLNTNLIHSFNLITDHSYSVRQKKYAGAIDEIFGKENIRTSEIHAKFTLIHNEDYKICIRTSMNLNANRTCENFEIDENEDIFNFYLNFIEHTFEEMPKGFVSDSYTVNKVVKSFFKTETEEKIKGWTET